MARRIPVSLIAVTLLLGSLSGASVAYVCAMTGEIGASCCCHAGELRAASRSQATVERASCCEVQRSEASHPLATCERSHEREGADVLALAPITLALPEPAARAGDQVTRDSRGPPLAHGPPLFIRNCSFLI